MYVDFKNGLNLEIPFTNESYSPFFGHPGHVEGGGEEFAKIDKYLRTPKVEALKILGF